MSVTMSKDHAKLEVIKESPKESLKDMRPIDLNDVEMVFGTPDAPKTAFRPDIHLITNEKNHGKNTHNNNDNQSHDTDTGHPTQPLLEPDRERQKPPLAGPEIDDLDDDVQNPTDAAPFPGIDDGLLDIDDNHDKKPEGHDDDLDVDKDVSHGQNGDAATDDDSNGIDNRFGVDDRPISPLPPGSIPDVNTYQQKKNLAQGMMDLALLSANANQLRYVLESSGAHPYYYPSLSLISISIIIQIAVGVGLIMNSRYNVKDDKDICKADKINNMTVLGIFLITIVNVFITSFSVATPTVPSAVTMAAVAPAPRTT